jgi:phage terminase large subunit-like protein
VASLRYPLAERCNRYARAVASGRVPSNKWVRLACERHLRDLKESSNNKGYPFQFDKSKAERILRFGSNMVHVKGKWAGQHFILQDWQCFFLGVPFGWVRRSDGLRRFREIYGEIPRKSGKSPLGAIIGNYMAWADGEIGSETYSGATSMDQAYEVFRPAWMMVHNNPEFKELFGLELGGTVKNPGPIFRLKDASKFQPVIGNPGDGASPSCAIVDEYHEHRTSALYDTMRTGMVGREQPMLVVITTAGVDTSVPCYDMHLDARKVLEGSLQRDDWFCIMYGMDDEDDWQDFQNWEKANPNFGISVLEDALRARYHEALTNPAKKNINLCKHANKWMNAGVAWMNMVKWEACRDDTLTLEDFENEECWVGLDLANRIDIAAMRLVFRYQDGFVGFGRYYLPSETVRAKENGHYQKWVEDGLIVETDGARTDFGRIVEDLKGFAGRFVIKELAYDPKEATFLIQQIQEESWASFDCVEITQGPLLMSEPMKEWEGLIYSGNYAHNGDPVMTWMMGNVVKKQGRGGGPVKTYYPTKERDANKIDGPVAELMALARALVSTPSDVGIEVW